MRWFLGSFFVLTTLSAVWLTTHTSAPGPIWVLAAPPAPAAAPEATPARPSPEAKTTSPDRGSSVPKGA